jgi:hypothetical protein
MELSDEYKIYVDASQPATLNDGAGALLSAISRAFPWGYPGDLEHLIGQNHLRIIPRACTDTNFAAIKALERHVHLVGFQQYLRFAPAAFGAVTRFDQARVVRWASSEIRLLRDRMFDRSL